MRLREEAKMRVQQKFGGGRMQVRRTTIGAPVLFSLRASIVLGPQGFGSDPDYDPDKARYDGGLGTGEVWNSIRTGVTVRKRVLMSRLTSHASLGQGIARGIVPDWSCPSAVDLFDSSREDPGEADRTAPSGRMEHRAD
jgi:hypothetical protein